MISLANQDNVLIPWQSERLESRERAMVRVMAKGVASTTPDGKDGEAVDTAWSEWATVEAALLDRSDWKAQFISSSKCTAVWSKDGGRKEYFRPIRLRKTFTIDSLPGRARLYITALGVYKAYLNGRRVGDEQMAPGWTSYAHRLQYQVFDVSEMLRANGVNTLAIEVAEGWYAGRLLWHEGVPCFYGEEIGALAQLEIYSLDSIDSEPSLQIFSDESWEWRESPMLASGIYDGETYDMREEEDGWADAHMPPPKSSKSASSWHKVKTLPFPQTDLLASPSPPVRVKDTISPVRIFESPSGKTLIDFGQNLVGKLVIHNLSKPSGHVLTIRHAEVLENGELGTRPLRSAKATDTITLSSKPLTEYSPHFTFHGFRYVEMSGWSRSDAECPLTTDSLSALVMHTDMPRTGHFHCSNAQLNRLHENVVWSTRSNFVSIPTDCPQRDERLGWTGDIQAFGPTAAFLFDVAGMLGNWMRDVVLDQADEGGVVPFIVPNVLKGGRDKFFWPRVPQAVWDDVVVLLPWTLYVAYGDTAILHQAYDGMKDYLTILPRADDGLLWDPDLWQLSDWLDPSAPPDNPGLSRTDGTLVADAYLTHVTRIMSRIAGILGHQDDEAHFQAQAEKLVDAFRRQYMTAAGLVVSDSQTALALTLLFNLHPSDPSGRATASARLGRLVRRANFKVSTGFAGTSAILPSLTCPSSSPSQAQQEAQNLQLAYRMLLETGCPSWIYPITQGATTIWERWDSMLPDGRVNPGEMTSFNHYALGSVATWMHAVIGGVSPGDLDEKARGDGGGGWKRFRVQPRPGGDVTSAKVDFLSRYGQVSCCWELVAAGSRFKMELIVPPNSTAVVILPDAEKTSDDRGKVVGSGRYHFECAFKQPGPWPPQPLNSGYDDFDFGKIGKTR